MENSSHSFMQDPPAIYCNSTFFADNMLSFYLAVCGIGSLVTKFTSFVPSKTIVRFLAPSYVMFAAGKLSNQRGTITLQKWIQSLRTNGERHSDMGCITGESSELQNALARLVQKVYLVVSTMFSSDGEKSVGLEESEVFKNLDRQQALSVLHGLQHVYFGWDFVICICL